MPCFNSSKHIEASATSVIQQTFTKWELIIIDDGSTDSSWMIIQRLKKHDHRIRSYRQENSGVSAARNKGIFRARGEYIAFLDSDDTWHPEFLETMLSALEDRPCAGLAYCGWQNIGLTGNRSNPFIPPIYEGINKLELLLGGCRWPIHAVLIRSSIIISSGGFDENFQHSEDYDLWLRTATENKIIRVSKVLAYYHHHEGERISSNRGIIAINQYKVQNKYINNNPNIFLSLEKKKAKHIIRKELLRRGYECYWKRDLKSAKLVFLHSLRAGGWKLNDLKYILPALLPESFYKALVALMERPA